MGKKTADPIAEIKKTYQPEYGESIHSLIDSLLQPPMQVARWNQFCSAPKGRNFTESLTWYENAFQKFPEIAPTRDQMGLICWYVMDAASLLPAVALGVKEGMSVLDLCAAPGGKSLVLAEQLKGTGRLYLNELSVPRRKSLAKICENYLPDKVRESVEISGYDGLRWGMYNEGVHDRVLLDAPCSGEGHSLKKGTWSSSASKRLAARQYGLICSALLSLKVGGHLVYSTCSISPLENDGVIKKLLKKKDVQLLSFESPLGVPTECGWFIRPDLHRYGPIYFSLLQKT